MTKRGDTKNIKYYLASEVLKAEELKKEKSDSVGISYEDDIYSINKQRQALQVLDKEGVIEIEKNHNGYVHQYTDNTPYDSLLESEPSRISVNVPPGAILHIRDKKKLKELAKKHSSETKPKNSAKVLYQDTESGDIYIKGKKVLVGKGTDHYFILSMFCQEADEDGFIENSNIIKFMRDNGITIENKETKEKKMIDESNVRWKMDNSVRSLKRFSKLPKGLPKNLITSVKDGKPVIGWQINI